jgi:Lon protease-like protein
MQIDFDLVLSQLPTAVPVLPVNGGVLFPRGILRLELRESHDLKLIDLVMASDRLVGVIQADSGDVSPSEPLRYHTGCLGRLKQFTDEEDGSYVVELRGLLRFELSEGAAVTPPYQKRRVDFRPFIRDLSPEDGEATVDREKVLNTLDRFIATFPQRIDWEAIYEATNEVVVNGLAIQGPFSFAEKQALLEARDLKARAELLVSLMEFEIAKIASGSTGGSSPP